MTFNNSRGVKSIEVGTRLLHILADAGRPMMLKQLALAANLAPAQVHTYLASFRRAKLVEQDGIAGMYRLGPFAIRLAQACIRSDHIVYGAIRSARELSATTGLSVDVIGWVDGRPIVLDVKQGLENLNIDVKPGLAFSLFKTCSGNAFVAFSRRQDLMPRLESDILAAIAEGHGKRRDLEKRFWDDIATARINGYTQTLDNPIPGVASIAAPVFGHDGDVAVVMALFGPKGSIDPAADSPLVRTLLAVCRRVSSRNAVSEPA